MPISEAINVTPSHNVSRDGGKVTIHDLELFVGHIPGFDADDSGMDELDSKAINKIIKRTKAHMNAGSNPKLVMLHQEENNDAPPEALGDIVDIRLKDINIRMEDGEVYSGPGIIGDVVMSKTDFDKYISSNRFPRRSAEIWKDGHMSEVALLGRETPARPLRDTRFGKQGNKTVYTRPVTFSEVAPGGSNTFVPATGTKEKKENQMPDKEEMLDIPHNGEEEDVVAKLRAENDTLREELEQLKMQMNEDAPEEEDQLLAQLAEDEEEDLEAKKYQEEDEEEEEKEMYSRLKRTKGGTQFINKYKKMKSDMQAYRKVARSLGNKVRYQKYSKVVDSLASDGFRIREHRDHMIKELISCSDPEEKINFWRSTITRDPIGRRLNIQGAQIHGKSEFSNDERKSATDRAVAKMTREGIDSDQFHSIFEQELKTG